MERKYKDFRRFKRLVITFALCLFTWHPLSAIIVMDTSQTELRVVVTDRVEERNSISFPSLQLPLCTIVIVAKHYGKGYLQIIHNTLSDGVEEISYTILCDNLGSRVSGVIPYECSPFLPLTIPLTKLSVELKRPLPAEHSSYSSLIIFIIKLEM